MLTSPLGMLYLASPALPIGAFAYSQGLESAIELGWVKDRTSLRDWLSNAIQNGLCCLDVPLIKRFRNALSHHDQKAVSYWDQYCLAARDTHELHAEEINLGVSLSRLIDSQSALRSEDFGLESFVGHYSRASLALGLDDATASMAYVWSWLENQVTVSCKTIPMGQTDAQTLLLDLMPFLEGWIGAGLMLVDDELSGSLPALSIASAIHEDQYSRLFRS